MPEFRKGALVCYMKLKANGKLNHYCGHYPKKFKYSYTNVMETASHYQTRTEFRNKDSGAYKYATTHGFREEACAHMVQGSTKYSNNDLKEIALKYTTRSTFQQGATSPYTIAWQRGILDDICQHMISYKFIYTEDNVSEFLNKYASFRELIGDRPHTIQSLRDKGFQYMLENHFEDYRPPIKWTNEMLQVEALKYKSRKKFFTSGSAAMVAWNRGIYDQITSHMPRMTNRSEDNVIYIWRVVGGEYDGAYKIGHTSLRSRAYRIVKVATELGVDYEIMVLTPTVEKASALESILHKIGTSVEMPEDLDGKTEFRELSYSELEECLFEIYKNKNMDKIVLI